MRLKQTNELRAFTLIELLTVIAIIAVLAALLLPVLRTAKARAKRVQCINQLRQTGLAFQSFAQDHNGQFPMAVPSGQGGSLEFAQSAYQIAGPFYFSCRHFQALSNELVTPKLTLCPADARLPASNFSSLKNENLSYAVAINADGAHPNSILAADRNLTNDWVGSASLVRLGPNNVLRWTSELHEFKGNLLFADGRVEEANSPGLGATRNQLPMVAELVLPSIGQPGAGASSGPVGLPGRTGPAISGTGYPAVAPGPGNSLASGAPSGSERLPTGTAGNRFSPSTTQAGSSGMPDAQPLQPPGYQTNVTMGAPSAGPQTDDPGFSLFPESFTKGVVKTAKWTAWLALLLLALLMTARWLKKRAEKRGPNWTRYEGP